MRETGLESFESTDARGRARVPEGWTLPRLAGTRTGAAMTHRRDVARGSSKETRPRRKETTTTTESPRLFASRLSVHGKRERERERE